MSFRKPSTVQDWALNVAWDLIISAAILAAIVLLMRADLASIVDTGLLCLLTLGQCC